MIILSKFLSDGVYNSSERINMNFALYQLENNIIRFDSSLASAHDLFLGAITCEHLGIKLCRTRIPSSSDDTCPQFPEFLFFS